LRENNFNFIITDVLTNVQYILSRQSHYAIQGFCVFRQIKVFLNHLETDILDTRQFDLVRYKLVYGKC